MFTKILVPVDLAHAEKMDKALSVASSLAQTYGAALCFVGVSSDAPTSVAHTPDEFAQKLSAFAADKGAAYGIAAVSEAVIVNDPAVELNHALDKTIDGVGADLVVMATHLPGVSDYIWAGHGAHVAAHSKASVFLVRD